MYDCHCHAVSNMAEPQALPYFYRLDYVSMTCMERCYVLAVQQLLS